MGSTTIQLYGLRCRLFAIKWAVFTYFHELLFIVRSLADAFERPTLRGCQFGGALDRVKARHTLTLPYQKANPDGVICGGNRWRVSLSGMLGVFDGLVWGRAGAEIGWKA